jgi:superfamily II DNA/RNA helicase
VVKDSQPEVNSPTYPPPQDDGGKWGWLSSNLERLVSAGKVLVFVSSKTGCDALVASLLKHGGGRFNCEAIHGDKDQTERSLILRRFKSGEVRPSRGMAAVIFPSDVAYLYV